MHHAFAPGAFHLHQHICVCVSTYLIGCAGWCLFARRCTASLVSTCCCTIVLSVHQLGSISALDCLHRHLILPSVEFGRCIAVNGLYSMDCIDATAFYGSLCWPFDALVYVDGLPGWSAGSALFRLPLHLLAPASHLAFCTASGSVLSTSAPLAPTTPC